MKKLLVFSIILLLAQPLFSQINPVTADDFIERGKTKIGFRFFDSAEQDFSKAIELGSNNYEAFFTGVTQQVIRTGV
ncbi:MAG TPA: hypothetical protein VHO68_06660 [Bacteroidales bacterium]|nr:hypothetical protein [Bacteroidales bacterium]